MPVGLAELDPWAGAPADELPSFMEPFSPDGAAEEDDMHLDIGIEAKGHNLLTHFPFDKNCPVCQNCKMQEVPHRRSRNRSEEHDGTEFPKAVGDQ